MAGGTVERELFSGDEDGWIEDAAWLDPNGADHDRLSRPTSERLRRIYSKPAPLTEDEEARREKLIEELDELASLVDGGGLTNEQKARLRD